jgi:serine/threonine-protein kinase
VAGDPTTSSRAWLEQIAEVAGRQDTERFLDGLVTAFRDGSVETYLPPAAATAARALEVELARLASVGAEPHGAPSMFEGVSGAIVLAWAESVAGRADVSIAGLLEVALRSHHAPSRLLRASRARIAGGPLIDALRCLPLSGDPDFIFDDAQLVARLDLLTFEAGSSVLSLPKLGPWLFSSPCFARLIAARARGTLLERVLAAQLLNMAADGYPTLELDAARGIQTSKIVRELASHPEPHVFIPASRAMGRLAAKNRDVRALLFRWLDSDSIGERRRALTALASMPDAESWWLETRLTGVLSSRSDAWTIASLGPAIPHLVLERRELFDDLVARISTSEDVAAEVLYSVTRGLVCIEGRRVADARNRALLEALRRIASSRAPRSTEEAQLLDDVRRQTDFLDGIDPDPGDLDLHFRRIASTALRVGADKVAPQTIALVGSVGPALHASIARLESPGPNLAPALSTAESCARALALRLWEPILGASSTPIPGVDTGMHQMLPRLLSLLESERLAADRHAVRRTALRVLGSIADSARSPPERSAIAHSISRVGSPAWLSDERSSARLEKPAGDLMWRLIDGVRGDIPAATLFGRFAVWWSLAAVPLELLDLLSRAEASARSGDRDRGAIHAIRTELTMAGAVKGAWVSRVHEHLEDLHADDTALAAAVTSMGVALAQMYRARSVRGPTAATVAILTLGEAVAELTTLLRDPSLAVGPPADAPIDERVRELARNAVRSIEGDDSSSQPDLTWGEALGPILGPLAERAVSELVAEVQTRGRSHAPRRRIGSYRLDRRLGGGTQGEVWLVENEKTGRRFVMKLLPPRGWSKASPERDALMVALQTEADILKQIYHPNVANFVDNGWDRDQPYLVLEYLVGCDLERYIGEKLLDLDESKAIMSDVASGLSALKRFGLVHCDLKPGNIFLRLELDAAQTASPAFDAAKHRDPRNAPVLGAVVIDFGISRTMAVSSPERADTISGTIGYIAPEQANGVIHPKTDVYALAATLFRSLTGRSFFDHLEGPSQRLLAHHTIPPMADERNRAHLQSVPAHRRRNLIELIERATLLDPAARPDVEVVARGLSAL